MAWFKVGLEIGFSKATASVRESIVISSVLATVGMLWGQFGEAGDKAVVKPRTRSHSTPSNAVLLRGAYHFDVLLMYEHPWLTSAECLQARLCTLKNVSGFLLTANS